MYLHKESYLFRLKERYGAPDPGNLSHLRHQGLGFGRRFI